MPIAIPLRRTSRGASLILLSVSLALAACAPIAGTPEPIGAATTTSTAATAMMPVTRVDRSRTDRNHDEAMGAQVLRRLTEADRNTFRAVSVQAWDNRVVLIGAVVKPLQRRRAEAIARTVEGVGIVDNEIILAEDKALAVFVPDAARERQLQGRLAGTASLGGAYGVRVANGVAFIVGTVGSADELDRLKSVVLDTDGIKWMVPHITVAGR